MTPLQNFKVKSRTLRVAIRRVRDNTLRRAISIPRRSVKNVPKERPPGCVGCKKNKQRRVSKYHRRR